MIVGEVLLISIVVMAISMIAAIVLRGPGPGSVFAEIWAWAENTEDARVVKLTLRHVGGDEIPDASPDKLYIFSQWDDSQGNFATAVAENYENEGSVGAFSFAEYLVCYLVFDRSVAVGDEVYISVNYSDPPRYERLLYAKTIPIE